MFMCAVKMDVKKNTHSKHAFKFLNKTGFLYYFNFSERIINVFDYNVSCGHGIVVC